MEKKAKRSLISVEWMHSIWFKRVLVLILDAGCVVLAYFGTLLFRFGGIVPDTFYAPFIEQIPAIIALHIAVNAVMHLYSSLWEHASIEELTNVVISCVISTVLSYVLSMIIGERMPRSIYIASGLVLMLMFGSIRLGYRVLRHFIKNTAQIWSPKPNALIVGAGDTGSMILKQMQERSGLDVRAVGFVDDDVQKQNIRLHGLRVLGPTSQIPRLVIKYNIKQIIFAVPSATSAQRRRILEICTSTGCQLKIVPGLEAILNGVDIKRIRDVEITDLLSREEVALNTEDVSGYLTGSTVLVTGGGGSIGSELCRQIMKFSPKRLVILDIYENNAYELLVDLKRIYSQDVPVSIEIGSVRDYPRVSAVMRRYMPDVVFHAAAHKHVPLMETSPSEAVKNNVGGTLNVARAADICGVKCFVQISTDKAVNPTNIMGATKLMCELVMQSMNRTAEVTRFVTVRFGNVLGSNGSVIPLFKHQIETGGPVTITHKDMTRYFMTIPEAAQLVIQAGSMAKKSEIFLLDMGKPVSIDDFARTFIRLSGFEPDVDMKIVYTGLRPGEKMHEELFQDTETLGESGFPGILVGKTHPLGTDDIIERVDYLLTHTASDPEHVKEHLAHVVPTYHPYQQDGEKGETYEG